MSTAMHALLLLLEKAFCSKPQSLREVWSPGPFFCWGDPSGYCCILQQTLPNNAQCLDLPKWQPGWSWNCNGLREMENCEAASENNQNTTIHLPSLIVVFQRRKIESTYPMLPHTSWWAHDAPWAGDSIPIMVTVAPIGWFAIVGFLCFLCLCLCSQERDSGNRTHCCTTTSLALLTYCKMCQFQYWWLT